MDASIYRSLATCLGLLIASSNGMVWAVSYSITELLPAKGDMETFAYGINAHGDVVGQSLSGDLSGSAVLWKNGVPGVPKLLSTLDGGNSLARGINDIGQISGYSGNGGTPVLWTNGIPANLATPAFPVGQASGINNAGKVVGEARLVGQLKPILWNGPQPLNIPLPGPNFMGAVTINGHGKVAGFGAWPDGDRAIVWNSSDGSSTILPSLGASFSKAIGINNAGEVVGVSSENTPIAPHAVVWNGSVITDLGVPLGARSEAVGINNFGKIVGSSGSFNPWSEGLVFHFQADLATAFLWDNGTPVNLFDASDAAAKGWSNLTVAYRINDAGQIIGEGLIDGQFRGFLLNAIPEPQTYLLTVIGLGLLERRLRRKRKPVNDHAV